MPSSRRTAFVSRRTAVAVLGACVVTLVAMWIYAESLDHWGDTRTLVFTVGTFVLGAFGLGALILLIADIVRERRA